jgi:hypothetical protein
VAAVRREQVLVLAPELLNRLREEGVDVSARHGAPPLGPGVGSPEQAPCVREFVVLLLRQQDESSVCSLPSEPFSNGRSDWSRRLRLTAPVWPGSTSPMDPPEETRELPDVTIRAQETSPGSFVASYHPKSPETHPARQGFSIDTKRGLRGKSLAKVLDFAEAYWRQNYPDR